MFTEVGYFEVYYYLIIIIEFSPLLCLTSDLSTTTTKNLKIGSPQCSAAAVFYQHQDRGKHATLADDQRCQSKSDARLSSNAGELTHTLPTKADSHRNSKALLGLRACGCLRRQVRRELCVLCRLWRCVLRLQNLG